MASSWLTMTFLACQSISTDQVEVVAPWRHFRKHVWSWLLSRKGLSHPCTVSEALGSWQVHLWIRLNHWGSALEVFCKDRSSQDCTEKGNPSTSRVDRRFYSVELYHADNDVNTHRYVSIIPHNERTTACVPLRPSLSRCALLWYSQKRLFE